MPISRDKILARLRAAQQPDADIEPVSSHLPVLPTADTSPQTLQTRFIEQAEALSCIVHQPRSNAEAAQTIVEIVSEDASVLSWAFEHIPLPGLEAAFEENDIQIADTRDASVRVGITGADAALAATGSLVLIAGRGKHRSSSLLPPVHVAVLRKDRIILDFEGWVAEQRKHGLGDFQQLSSVMLISGPSKTADIAMQLVMGMHGPAELHIVLVG